VNIFILKIRHVKDTWTHLFWGVSNSTRKRYVNTFILRCIEFDT